MGTRLDNLKSKVRQVLDYFSPGKRVLKFPSGIDYDRTFKNHAVLMNAYGTVLKRDSKTFDTLFRSLFIESHIYKKLRLLKKIYLVEIAILYNPDNNTTRSKLNELIEDINKLSSSLFCFPTIGWREIFYILPTFAAAIAVVYHLWGLFPESWSQGVDMSAYLTIITALGLTFLVYLGLVALSFVEKRRFFVFPEYKAIMLFDRLQKRWNAFLGRNNEGTIYEKENKLFDSLRRGKETEFPVDIVLIMVIILCALEVLVMLSILPPTSIAYLFWLLLMPFLILFTRIRKAW